MVNARLCETARLAFFFASPRHFDFVNCETETSKHFKCERETLDLSLNKIQISSDEKTSKFIKTNNQIGTLSNA